MTAARDYKDITGGMTDAVARVRRQDTERATQLGEELVELQDRMHAAGNRATLSEIVTLVRWELAMEALWAESWMTLRPLPLPDPNAAPGDLDYLDAVVEQRFQALLAVVGRRPLLGRR